MKVSKKKILFPFYHLVDNNENSLTKHLYASKNEVEFIKDLKFLKKKLTALSFDDIINDTKNDSYGFFLTFDDGLHNFYSVVAPILIKEDVRAINFLNSDFIDNRGLFFRFKVNLLIEKLSSIELTEKQKFEMYEFGGGIGIDSLMKATQKDEEYINKVAEIFEISFEDYLQNEKPYLKKEQIVDLIHQGFYFGGHSKSHPYYDTLKLDEQIFETIESVKYVAKEFKLKNRVFAFPFSDDGVSLSFFNEMEKENIISFGTAGLKDEDIPNHFQRIPMEYKSKYSAETIIKGELLYYLIKKLVKKHKIIRK